MKINHYAIFGTDFRVKGKWMQQLLAGNAPAELHELTGKKGLLFSEVFLNQFIEEDFKHGNSVLVQKGDRSLRTFSSGEKRKALLNYLLAQKPDFLVLDNPFDNLDQASVANLKEQLEQISENISIIQIFKRKEDLQPFVASVMEIEGEKVKETTPLHQFKNDSTEEISTEIKTIPAAPLMYEDVPEVLVSLQNVSVAYDEKPILNEISWEIRKGDFWQLTGPNGSGKTTLLSMIYGDNPKAYGVDLYLFGNKKGTGESVWEIKQKIGYFSPALTELFTRRNTVLEMLISGLADSIGLYQKPSDKEVRLAKDWLEILNMASFSNSIFTDLSELQQRMILIARAMIKHPPLLILDEPTTSLDSKSALEISSLINLIAKESETAIIFVSQRAEKNLKPKAIYWLIPSQNGSKGEILVD